MRIIDGNYKDIIRHNHPIRIDVNEIGLTNCSFTFLLMSYSAKTIYPTLIRNSCLEGAY
jgi:hypothetical protein